MHLLFFMIFCLAPIVFSNNYYDLLGISKDADNREIRKAFKRLALKLHPDKNKDKSDAQEEFIKINKAYEVLKDEEMRKKYDLYGEDGLKENFGNSWKGNFHSWNYYYESFGIYDDDPEIVTLTKADFVQSVLDSSDLWFVNFYSPQCSHCHTLAPAWRELARELEGIIRIGAVNCEEDWMLCRQQNVHSYPSIISYPQKSKYQGSRESEAMIEYVLQQFSDNTIDLTLHNYKDLFSQVEYRHQPWMIFICSDKEECVSREVLKKLSIILERLVNVAEYIITKEKKICKFINCDSQVSFYPDTSLLVENKKVEHISIDETETREIVNKILEILPEVKEISDIDFQNLRKDFDGMSSSPWLILFTNKEENISQLRTDLKRLKAVLLNVSIGRYDCQKYLSSCSTLFIQKFPTFILFKPGSTFEFHHGRNTFHDIARFVQEGLASQVQTLNPKHFPEVTFSAEPWFIDFFAPWCPPCMKLLPEWRKASHSTGHLVKFGTVDCTIHRSLCGQYSIKAYPTTILYNQTVAHTFHGSHTRHHIEEFIKDILNPIVISLNPRKFDDLVKRKSKNDIWVIDYFVPWCAPCQQLAPELRKLAKLLTHEPSIHIGEVDCQEYEGLCSSAGVSSYPAIRLYPKGVEGIKKFHFYNGWNRDAASIQAWIYDFLPSNVRTLSAHEFQKEVLTDTKPWLIDFYAPWCSHCQMFSPEFEKVAKVLESKVNAGNVNCDKLPQVCRQAGVRQYPTVLFYEGGEDGRTQNPVSEEVHLLTFDGVISFVESRLNLNIKKPLQRDEL